MIHMLLRNQVPLLFVLLVIAEVIDNHQYEFPYSTKIFSRRQVGSSFVFG